MAEESSDTTNKKEIGSAFDLLGKSWNIVKSNWQAFAVVNIFVILGAIADSFVTDSNNKGANSDYGFASSLSGFGEDQLAAIVGGGLLIVLLIVALIIFLATMKTGLEVKSAVGKKPNLSELFNDGKKYFFRFFLLCVLLAIIIVTGFILLIVPGIIALGRLIMAPYHMLDKDLGVIEAIKHSNEQAKGNMSKVYAAIGVMIVVSIGASILGAIPILGPLAGAVVTIGFSVVLALRYQELKKSSA